MNGMLLLDIAIGYVLGSIPFALVIGKLFYHTDVRQYGSGNLGGTNAGRILGKKAGIATILLDVGKVVAAVAFVTLVLQDREAGIRCLHILKVGKQPQLWSVSCFPLRFLPFTTLGL